MAIAVSSAALFLMVITRIWGLLARIDGQARQLTELALFDGWPCCRTVGH